jgi:hypothetical protein
MTTYRVFSYDNFVKFCCPDCIYAKVLTSGEHYDIYQLYMLLVAHATQHNDTVDVPPAPSDSERIAALEDAVSSLAADHKAARSRLGGIERAVNEDRGNHRATMAGFARTLEGLQSTIDHIRRAFT